METNRIKVTVICSTYNQPHFLGLVLSTLKNQKFKDFEVIIPDDGSGPETKKVIDHFKEIFPVPMHHLWQEDKGFRKAKIHNEAIRMAQGDLLIFMDGDIVVTDDFVGDHYSIYESNKHRPYVFMGRRVEVGPELTKTLTNENVKDILSPHSARLLLSCLKKDSRNFFRAYRITNPILRKVFKSDSVKDLLGCNFSTSKETMIGINGFNENFETYWGEDGDVFVRLRNYGCKLVGMKSYAVCFHLYHSRRSFTKEDEKAYYQILENKDYKWCENGLVKNS